MSTRPTSRESECKVKKFEIERESFQEAISAVSYLFYTIDANYYKILKANADGIELHSGQFNQPICYCWRHKFDTLQRRRTTQSFQNNRKTKPSDTVELTQYDNRG